MQEITAMFNAHQGLIQFCIQKFIPGIYRQQFQEDLEVEAGRGLLTAINKFDAKRKTKFSTYATQCIRGKIMRFLYSNAHPIRIPEYLAINISGKELGAMENKNQISAYRAAHSCFPLDGNLDIKENQAGISSSLESNQKNTQIHKRIRLLPELPRKIVSLHFGLGYSKPLSIHSISKLLGLNRNKVSKIYKQAIADLAKSLESWEN